MVLRPQPPHGARIAQSALRAIHDTRCRPCRNMNLSSSTARLLSTATRPRAAPLALGQQHTDGSHNIERGRRYATAGPPRPRQVAVLGGGLTGLSAAWYLTKFIPNVKVTIYEGSGRYGGWIDSERVPVTAADGTKGTVVFERGARLVQPKSGLQNWDDVAFFELLADIRPGGDGWRTMAQYDRYFYYPDHLVRLPQIPGLSDPIGSAVAVAKLAYDAFTEPLYVGLPAFAFNMMTDSPLKKPSFEDVSIGDEFLRRGGRREPVENMLSAMCHGIYGGDVWKLSAESSIFGTAFVNNRLRRPSWQTVHLSMQDVQLLMQLDPKALASRFLETSRKFKAYNFGDGFGTLTDCLVERLRANNNVRFVEQKVTKVRPSPTGKVEVITSTPRFSASQYDKVISSLYAKTLASLAPPHSLPSLAKSTAVTIRLVNLWSPIPNLNYKTKGFGYLIPQSVPMEQNPHAALGVIFDSDRTKGLDPYPPIVAAVHHPCPTGDTVPGTKFTVMLGGHHWDDIPAGFLPDAATDDAAAIEAAKSTIEIQMGIPASAWTASSTKLCVDCIPQHLVGHTRRMASAHEELQRTFGGKLAVCGGSYTAPGVVGSIRAARDVAFQMAGLFRRWREPGTFRWASYPDMRDPDWSVGETGLARFAFGMERLWRPVSKQHLKVRRSGQWRTGGK